MRGVRGNLTMRLPICYLRRLCCSFDALLLSNDNQTLFRDYALVCHVSVQAAGATSIRLAKAQVVVNRHFSRHRHRAPSLASVGGSSWGRRSGL